MTWYCHTDEEGRIDGRMPGTVEVSEFDYEKGEVVLVEIDNFDEGNLELGWFEWPFSEPIPDDYWDYAIEDGKLVHVGRKPLTDEQIRAQDIAEAHDELPEIQEGLMEVARMAADNETTLEDIEEAIVELAALIGGE